MSFSCPMFISLGKVAILPHMISSGTAQFPLVCIHKRKVRLNELRVQTEVSVWICITYDVTYIETDKRKPMKTLKETFSVTLGGSPTLWKRRPTLGTISKAYFLPLDFALSMAL